jgi:hypothetical protein
MMTDAMGYIELMELTGNEFLRMKFSKTSNDNFSIDKLFRVYKVAKRGVVNNMNTESYCLYFTSEETILNEQTKVCRAYPNKIITDNVIDILKTDLGVPDNKLNVKNFETTYGQYQFVIPNIKPFDAINFVTNYARPNPQNPGADMLFYEDKNGFQYRSLQSLMRQPSYYTYTYKPKNIDGKDLNTDAHNVLTY